jgi:hypothetical protein
MSKILDLIDIIEEDLNVVLSRTEIEKVLRQDAYDMGKRFIDILFAYIGSNTLREGLVGKIKAKRLIS